MNNIEYILILKPVKSTQAYSHFIPIVFKISQQQICHL